MQYLRQLGGGIIIAIFSVILVIGGVFLSLAETLPAPPTPTQIPPTLPLSFPTPTYTSTTLLLTETPTATQTATSTATEPALATAFIVPTYVSCTPPSGWMRIVTTTSDTLYSLAQRYKTSAESLSTANCLPSFDVPAGFALYVPPVPTVTVIPCGPPAGWIRGYIVRPGDTLYRIALSYGLSYTQLQRANCMGNSTTIYAGQRLWVPNIPTRTPFPGVTNLPGSPTATPTSLPPTEVPPTSTSVPTSAPTATQAPTETQAPPVIDTPVTQPPGQ